MTRQARQRVCSTPGCPNWTTDSRCTTCAATAERQRPSGAAKYGPQHRTRFRPGVLAKNGGTCAGITPGGCDQPATIADHWPLDRDELQARGLDPNDPTHGRPLCKRHHDMWTARTKPAGWNQPAP